MIDKLSTTCTGFADLGPILFTLMNEVIFCPIATGEGAFVLTKRKSDWSGFTLYVTVSVSLSGIGSVVVVATVALFWCEIIPPVSGASAVTIIVSVRPTFIKGLSREQVITGFALTSQVQPIPLALIFVYPRGNISVIFTSAAPRGPLLVISSAKVTFCSAITIGVITDLLIIISVPAVTFKISVSVLSLGLTSKISDVTVAALIMVPVNVVTCALK